MFNRRETIALIIVTIVKDLFMVGLLLLLLLLSYFMPNDEQRVKNNTRYKE